MARTPGTFPVSFNLEPQIKGPLDARMIVDTYADLTGFTAGNYLKNGFIVSVFDPVPSKRGVYQLIDENNLGATASWVLIGANGPQGTQGPQGYNGVDGIVGGQMYYFNESVAGYTGSYKKLANSPISHAEVTVPISLGATESGKLISQYMTDSLNLSVVPGGVQRFYAHFAKDSAVSNIEVYAAVLLADQDGNTYYPGIPQAISYSSIEAVGWNSLFPVEINMDVISETTAILPTDRIVIRLYATNLDPVPRALTFYTEGSQNYSYIRTSTAVAPGATGSQGPRGFQGFQGFQGLTGATEAPLTELTISGARNSINKVFTLSNPLIVGTSHMFFINGELQVYGVDYTISGTILTLSAGNPAPTATDSLRIFGTIGNIIVGIQGNQGYQGPQGFQGLRGFQGFQGFQGPQGIQGPTGPQGGINKLFNTQVGLSYTLANTDTNLILHFTAAGNITVTVPVGLSPYNRYEGKQLGLGQVGFTAGTPVGGTSVSIITALSEYPKTAEQYSAFALDYIGLSGSIEQYMLYGKLALV